jgi:hypothetical protein
MPDAVEPEPEGPPPQERRRRPRVSLRCTAEWSIGVDKPARTCHTGTLSMVGASLEFGERDKVDVNESGILTLRLPDPYGEFAMAGRVVWIGNSNGRPIAGVEFSTFHGESEQKLQAIIKRAAEEGRD